MTREKLGRGRLRAARGGFGGQQREATSVRRTVCIHRLAEIDAGMLAEFVVAARTTSREDLLTAVGSTDIAVVVVDLDEPDTQTLIVRLLEVRPNLGVVGASVMGTSGARNPTLTAQALAWRTGEYLTRRWKDLAT